MNLNINISLYRIFVELFLQVFKRKRLSKLLKDVFYFYLGKDYLKSTSSTSKIRAAPGGITPPAPLSP